MTPRSRRGRSLHRRLPQHLAAPLLRVARDAWATVAPLLPVARDPRGLTFVEVLVATVLLVLVVGALLPMLTVGQQTWEVAPRRTTMIQNARVAMDRIVREMRAAETFELLSSSTLRFTMYTGGKPVPTTPAWWNTAWPYRQRITVTAGSAAVPNGYSTSVTYDHAGLVSAGKSLASGNDVRLLHWTGASWVELDRFLDVSSAWNTTATSIWFRLQAAIAASGSDNNYYLYYGNLSAGAPPANGDNVFLDYEDGSSLTGWTDRDSCLGTYSTSADGFVFSTSSTSSCHRQFSKNVPHSNVEIFWGFNSASSSSSAAHGAGVSARRSDSGAGYVVAIASDNNTTTTLRYWTVWATIGGDIGTVSASITPGTDYYGRFYLVGSALKVKYWAVGAAEPGWMIQTTHSSAASGNHYGQVDGYTGPMTHRHRTIIVRQRIDPEPATTLDSETSITVMTVEYQLNAVTGELEYRRGTDPWQPLAGAFRSMSVTCFDAANASISCTPASSVRSVQVSLVAMDPQGVVSDITVTSRAYRQAP